LAADSRYFVAFAIVFSWITWNGRLAARLFRDDQQEDEVMNDNTSRPIGNTPITDAAASTAPDESGNYASNADLRVNEDAVRRDAAITATGEDVDNDHADERPVDRSQDAPETHNSEQDDEQSQAQTIADDAIRGLADRATGGQTGHGGHSNPAQVNPDDAQDVVDHMNQMDESGRIDMDAYRGERSDDDEPQSLGEGGMESGDLDEHGNRPRDQQYTGVE
jgi:hypothetical protein